MNKRIIFFIIVVIFLGYKFVYPYISPKYVSEKIDRNSIWYVNDLYMSDQYYYENILNENEKAIYLQLFEALNNLETRIVINGDFNSVQKVYDAIMLDHPEMINLTTYSGTYNERDNITNFMPTYITTSQKELDKMVLKVQNVITKVEKKTRNMTEYEKELYVYEWLGDNSRYRVGKLNRNDQSAYTALISSKNTVCAGFGKGAQILFQNVGINSYLLLSANHIWNLVSIDGDYYYFDATCTYVPNCYNTSSHFGLNTTYYSFENYNIKYTTDLPKPNGTKYLYYDYNDLIINGFDELQKIIDKTDKNSQFIEFKLKNNDMDKFFSDYKANLDKVEELGLRTNGVSYINDVIRIKTNKL